MLGGADDDIADVRPLLDDLAGDIFHLGPVGAGAATKLANQLIMFATLEGVHEALGITRANGVSDDAVLKAVATGTGDTWVGRNWGFFDKVASAYNEADVPVSDRPWSKDLWEVVSAGRDAEISIPLAGLLAQIMSTVIEDHAAEPESMNGAPQ
jgi:3-hydroxyisobutyrate dehydrogenase